MRSWPGGTATWIHDTGPACLIQALEYATKALAASGYPDEAMVLAVRGEAYYQAGDPGARAPTGKKTLAKEGVQGQ